LVGVAVQAGERQVAVGFVVVVVVVVVATERVYVFETWYATG
jgi:hypothetical protein